VGTGAKVGIRPDSRWNNPEPEVVLAVNARAEIVGAALGNDVNLRDVEGRSPLLLGEAKDNTASCAIGPWFTAFEPGRVTLDDVMRTAVTCAVSGLDSFAAEGTNDLGAISRDPRDLVRQATGARHQYPDGFVLFLGTMYVPTADRDGAGEGFTHHVGDVVRIANPILGELVNTVDTCDAVPPWQDGVRALWRNLASRGLA
jgi:fumarylacetoacetate (FAA) hydrolase family protein